MLKFLRKKGVMKKILWFIAIMIIISFGFLGQVNTPTNTGYAGKIFGKKISFEDFGKIYEQTRIQALIRYGENFSKIQPFLNLEAETWDRLTLLQEAKKRKIRIADKEVVRAIEEYPFFKREGQFDALLYNNILKYVFKVTPNEFEEGIRDSLKFKKIYEEVTSPITVSEEEVFNDYHRQNEKIKVSYVLFAANDFQKDIPYDEQKALQFYLNNKEAFRISETINVAYLSIESQPEQTSDKKALAEKTKTIHQELIANPDFEAVAAKNNLSLQTSGFFSFEQPNLKVGGSYEVLQKIFDMQPGQISEPMEIPQGFQIVKILEKKAAHIPEFTIVREKVQEALTREEGMHKAQEKAKQALPQIQEKLQQTTPPDFKETTQALGLNIQQTPFFNRGQYLPEIGISKDFQDAAFSLTKENNLSEVVQTTTGFSILFLDENQEVDQAAFEKDKEKFAQGIFDEKRNQAFNDFLSQLRLKANLEDNISKLKTASVKQ